jgi:pyruvate/2-oxoglutarate dehydrogenase complex dihydrolipoamide dehydrogenase (E3) component
MAERYDAVVIGAGPAGEVCAGELADGGMRTAICERQLVAGECSYWACIPSKTLLRSSEAIEAARQAPGAREAVSGAIDPSQAFAWRDFMVSDYDDAGQVKWLDGKGIDLFRGEARMDGPGQVVVGEEMLETERIVFASGSEPVIPSIEGLRELEGVWTNREATGAKAVPERLIVLGGGPVGVEMGQALARFGASVAIAESSDRLLSKEADAAGEKLAEALEEEGIELMFGARATAAARHGDGYSLSFEDGSELRGDALLVATGRRPRTDELGLDRVEVHLDEGGGIKVDEQLRAGDGLWAIGDVTGIMPFTHVGKYQARIAAADILGRGASGADYRAVPRVVFTDPQVAAVGRPRGEREGSVSLASIARTSTYTREYAERPGLMTLFADDDHLVGAVAVGPEAGEWLQQATLAIRAEVPIPVLRDVIQPFPTFSEAFVSALADLEA